MRNLFIVCALIWMPAALGSESYSIQNVDQRNYCLPLSKNDSSQCFKIRHDELREHSAATLARWN